MTEIDTIQKSAAWVFAIALVVRIGGVTLTTLTDINPDSGNDANGFASTAQAYATGEFGIQYFLNSLPSAYPTWGFFLSPFWHIPGPSRVYARLGMAIVGAFAIYNIYLIVAHHVSRQAGAFAVAPLITLPSFVALHSVVLRDVAIICGLVYAVRLLSVPSRWPVSLRYIFVLFAVGIATLLRVENLPVYAAMAGTGIALWIIPKKYYRITGLVGGLVAVASYPIWIRMTRAVGILGPQEHPLEFLSFMRQARIREGGRTQYLADIVLETPLDMLFYAPVSAVYFLFVPLPGMAEIPVDYIMTIESLVTIAFAIAAVFGVYALWQRSPPLVGALLVGFVLFAVLYGIISTNVGTSVRQRQVLSWVLFVFGGIGVAERYHLQFQWTTSEEEEEETMASD